MSADVEALEQREKLTKLCHALVERARQKGASDVEVYAEQGVSTTVSLEQNDIKGAEIAEHTGVGMRVFLGDKLGFAYVNRLDTRALDEALDDALAIAKAAPGDPANVLCDPRLVGEVPGLWDPLLAELSPEEVVRRANEMREAALAVDGRVRIDSGSFTSSRGHSAIATSKGVAAATSETAGVYGLFGMAVDGDEVGSFDHVFESHRALGSLAAPALGKRFGEKVLALLHPVPGKSYRGKVVLTTEALEEVLVQALIDAVDGDAVYKGKSRLKEKLGQPVAASSFTLIDDGTLPGRPGSSAFDREGMPHRQTHIVNGGVLMSFLYDGRAAKRAGTSSTGHAQGSARSLPAIGTTNLCVTQGELPEARLLAEAGEALLLGRFSGNVDGVSGDFSGVAKGSFLLSGGERGRPVKETLVAGNVFDLLERVVALGSEVHRVDAFEGPWVLVDGVDVTAG